MIVEAYEKMKKDCDDVILTYEQEKLKAEGNHKTPTKLVRPWFHDCAKLQKNYGARNTEIQAEGKSSQRQEERISKMEEMKNLTTRYHQFNGFSNMFVDQPLKTVGKKHCLHTSEFYGKEQENSIYSFKG